jgi:hypothetical protein
VDDISVIAFVARLLHLLARPKEKARSGLLGLAFGTESGWMRLGCMNVIWFAGRCWDAGTITVKRRIIEALVHLASGAHSRRSGPFLTVKSK